METGCSGATKLGLNASSGLKRLVCLFLNCRLGTTREGSERSPRVDESIETLDEAETGGLISDLKLRVDEAEEAESEGACTMGWACFFRSAAEGSGGSAGAMAVEIVGSGGSAGAVVEMVGRASLGALCEAPEIVGLRCLVGGAEGLLTTEPISGDFGAAGGRGKVFERIVILDSCWPAASDSLLSKARKPSSGSGLTGRCGIGRPSRLVPPGEIEAVDNAGEAGA